MGSSVDYTVISFLPREAQSNFGLWLDIVDSWSNNVSCPGMMRVVPFAKWNLFLNKELTDNVCSLERLDCK